MKNQKGFDSWIPIFKGGKQTDSNGVEHDGDALMDKAIAKFNAAVHEPPAVIGHPKEDAPAYGWVEGLKKQGNLLMAKFKQVQPAFADMVKTGLIKKRSAAFYPDGSLRHVGFLGAMPPAVKGLPDVAFAEGDSTNFEFSDYETVSAWQDIARLFGKIRDYIIEKEGVEKADQIIDKYNIEEIAAKATIEKENADENKITLYKEKEETDMSIKDQLVAAFSEVLTKFGLKGESTATPTTEGQQFSEADLEKIRKEAEAKGKEKATAEFAEQQHKTRMATIKTDIAAFCETLLKAGRISAATIAFGLPDILFSMAEVDNQIEFGEKKEKATAFDRMKALLESATPLILFKETATRDKDGGGAGSAGVKLEKLTAAKMKEFKDLTYTAAFAEVQKENPELTQEYTQEISGV
jgi:hypothetical protein